MQDPTLNTWNKLAGLYEEKFMDLTIYDGTYDQFITMMNRSVAKILDVGCGPGNIARYLFRKNPAWQFHGVDAAPNMADRFRKNIPGSIVTVMDIREIEDLEGRFDGITAGFCIPFLNNADTARMITAFRRLLNPEGCVYISFVVGDPQASGLKTANTGDQTFFYYHRLDRIQEIMQSAGFQVYPVIEVMYSRSADQQEKHTVLLGKVSGD